MLLRIVFGLAVCAFVFPGPAVAQDHAKAEKVFAANKCVMCHAIGAKGNKKGPLDEVGSKLTKDEIRAWITDAEGMAKKSKSTRKPLMKSVKLPADELDALVDYLASLKKK